MLVISLLFLISVTISHIEVPQNSMALKEFLMNHRIMILKSTLDFVWFVLVFQSPRNCVEQSGIKILNEYISE